MALLFGCALSNPVAVLAATRLAPSEGPAELQAQPAPVTPGPPQARVPIEPKAPTGPTEPASPTAPAGPVNPENPTEPDSAWLEKQRLVVEEQLGDLVEGLDLFFDKTRRLDLEAPSSRFRLKTLARTSEVEDFAMGFAVGTSISLPRLNDLFGNARLLLFGEKATTRLPLPPGGKGTSSAVGPPSTSAESDAAVAELTRGRGRAELRFDVVRAGNLVFDTGAGVTFAWPPVAFANIRAHLRLKLGAGFMLRATDLLFIQLGGLGPGDSLDLELERFLGPALRLRWEGHGLYAQHTRGIEWSTLVGAEWKPHPRTGFFSGVGCSGFGTPSPGLDVWRVSVGFRQDVWRGSIFTEVEPGIAWPRPAGMARASVRAVTVRLEVVVEGRGAARVEQP